MKSNHLLLLALKKVREHVGEGTNTFRFLTSELGLLRSIQGIADVRTALSVDRGASGVFSCGDASAAYQSS